MNNKLYVYLNKQFMETNITTDDVIEKDKELDQYKNNWEELKKCLEDDLKEVYRDAGYRHRLILEVLNKMKELEENN